MGAWTDAAAAALLVNNLDSDEGKEVSETVNEIYSPSKFNWMTAEEREQIQKLIVD